MAKKSGALNRSAHKLVDDQNRLLKSLRAHGQVVESSDPDVELGPRQTHVYVKASGAKKGTLIEKRKSFF